MSGPQLFFSSWPRGRIGSERSATFIATLTLSPLFPETEARFSAQVVRDRCRFVLSLLPNQHAHASGMLQAVKVPDIPCGAPAPKEFREKRR
jgi:hypothetical protein